MGLTTGDYEGKVAKDQLMQKLELRAMRLKVALRLRCSKCNSHWIIVLFFRIWLPTPVVYPV